MDAERRRLVTALRNRAGPHTAGVPLTADQQAIWLAEQVDPGRSGYNVTAAVRIGGPLDTDMLRAAFGDVRDRHEALRCRVVDQGGGPRQFFDGRHFAWAQTDLVNGSPGARDIALQRLTALESTRPFDLAEGPLWRVRLVRTSPDVHVLILVMHHLITDGWSLGVLLRDLLARYMARQRGEPDQTPTPGHPYAEWIAAKIRRERLADTPEAIARVTGRLGAVPCRPALPGLNDSEAETYAQTMPIPCPKDAWPSFARVCHRLGATSYMGLAGLFGLLLARSSDERELVMAAPLADRADPATAQVIGCMISAIPLSLRPSPSESLVIAIAAGRRALTEALRDADVQYRTVARALNLPHGTGDPLTSIGLEEFNVVLGHSLVAGLTIEPLPRSAMRIRHDLTLSVPSGLRMPPELLFPAARWAPGSVAALADELAGMVLATVAVHA
jgi:Condensation domain